MIGLFENGSKYLFVIIIFGQVQFTTWITENRKYVVKNHLGLDTGNHNIRYNNVKNVRTKIKLLKTTKILVGASGWQTQDIDLGQVRKKFKIITND